MVFNPGEKYAYKVDGVFKVSAQIAGEELNRIYNDRGELTPHDIVDEARPQDAVLHPIFEWNDEIAAEKYRERQARDLIRCIVTVVEKGDMKPVEVRAYVKSTDKYEPITVTINRKEKMDKLLETAIIELKQFQKKYAILSKLQPVFDVIEQLDIENVS